MNEENNTSIWQQAAISGGAHLQRMMEMYEELGFEVRLEEISPEDCGQCTECYQESDEKIYRVYTRHKKDNNN